MLDLEFTRKGRSWATLITVVVVWVLILIGWFVFSAAIWILIIVILFTLPALWDLWGNTKAGALLTSQTLSWYSGSRRVEIALDQIDHVRLVTRLDMTVRAAPVLLSGQKIRMPPEATPPHKDFEKKLKSLGIKTERHHFTFL